MEQWLEDAYVECLIEDGVGEDTIAWFREMANINQRTFTYFVIAAMQEFRIGLDQDPSFLIELEDEEEAPIH